MSTPWRWASASLEHLATVVPVLVDCCDATLRRSAVDLAAREGRRDRETQERYFAAGLSRARWGQSEHNAVPPELARAIHLIPLPLARRPDGSVDWSDLDWRYRCAQVAALMDLAAQERGVEIVWGGWWSFRDLCHFELRIGA